MSDKDNKELDNGQESLDNVQQNEQEAGNNEQQSASSDSNEVQAIVSDEFENGSNSESANEEVSASKGGKVWPIVSLVLAVALIIVLIKPPFATSNNEIVATVNGVKISKSDLYDSLVQAGGNDTLQGLIEKELVNQEATKQNIVINQDEIDEIMAEYEKSFGDRQAIEAALASSGMTMDDLIDNIQMNLKLNKLLESKITITDDQIQATFEQYQDSFNTPEQVRASVILVGTEEEAKEIVKQLNEGADFAELAKSKSLDAVTKDNGGDLDYFAKGQMEEEVENVAFSLNNGEISEPIQTQEGYKVIKVTDHKEAHVATLEESKEEIREGLVSQQVSQMAESYFAELEGKATITNKLAEEQKTDTENK